MKQITINLNRVCRLEDTKLKDVDSVTSYIEELAWFRSLIDHHTHRCTAWDRETPRGKAAYGKLNEFLSQFDTTPMKTPRPRKITIVCKRCRGIGTIPDPDRGKLGTPEVCPICDGEGVAVFLAGAWNWMEE